MLREFAGLLKRGSSIAVVVALAAFVGKANALAYVGEYDPPFVTDFSTDSSWSGQVKFEVPDTCILSSGILTLASCPNMKFLSATVDIKDSGGLLDTLVFPASYFSASLLTAVSFNQAGLPDGVNGFFVAPVFSDEVRAIGSVSGTLFWLSFDNFLPKLTWVYKFGFGESPTSGTPGQGGVPKWDEGGFRVVPEPGSLALLLSALGVLGFVRSRKNRATTAPLA